MTLLDIDNLPSPGKTLTSLPPFQFFRMPSLHQLVTGSADSMERKGSCCCDATIAGLPLPLENGRIDMTKVGFPNANILMARGGLVSHTTDTRVVQLDEMLVLLVLQAQSHHARGTYACTAHVRVLYRLVYMPRGSDSAWARSTAIFVSRRFWKMPEEDEEEEGEDLICTPHLRAQGRV